MTNIEIDKWAKINFFEPLTPPRYFGFQGNRNVALAMTNIEIDEWEEKMSYLTGFPRLPSGSAEASRIFIKIGYFRLTSMFNRIFSVPERKLYS